VQPFTSDVLGDAKSMAERSFLAACRRDNIAEAMFYADTYGVSKERLKEGLRIFAIEHQSYTGIGALLAKSGVCGKDGITDGAFVTDVLAHSLDPMAAVLFLNGLKAKYSEDDISIASIRCADVVREALRNGRMIEGNDVTPRDGVADVPLPPRSPSYGQMTAMSEPGKLPLKKAKVLNNNTLAA
jgi:hypothetical protein